ncbi:MAG: inorganic phosphate transporter [Oligoflexales bacterium]
MPDYDAFLWFSLIISIVMLVWSCVEVGSNDAANLVNAVSGASILKRTSAVFYASVFVVLGALCSGQVMDTVRKSIFDVGLLSSYQMISIFISSYFINTVILFVCSCYGLPVSTTATLVFSLAGGSLGVMWSSHIVHWDVLIQVGMAMVFSIFLSGVLGFIAQKFLRKFIGPNCRDPQVIRKHGGWIGAFSLSFLIWFLLFKGFNNLAQPLLNIADGYVFFIGIFIMFFMIISLCICFFQEYVSRYLFDFLAIFGMFSMAFAFGQNDLANCASPGLAIIMIFFEDVGGQVSVPWWALLGCGLLISLGMNTKRAKRVTEAEMMTASQKKSPDLYVPGWCLQIVKKFKKPSLDGVLLSQYEVELHHQTYYDPLRACVILTVSASVIVLASSFGLPVSTTYVNFAAVVASGWGDQVFIQESAEQKLGRAIWVVACWCLSILAAVVGTACMAYWVDMAGICGLMSGFLSVVVAQFYFKKISDEHDKSHFS